MKKVYLYDYDGYFAGEGFPQIDPLESQKAGREILIMPANATEIEPPEDKEGFRIKWDGSSWEYEEIQTEPEPEPEPEPTAEDLKNIRIAELQNYLNATDWYAVRFAETGVAVPEDVKAERQAAREEISRLRDNNQTEGE